MEEVFEKSNLRIVIELEGQSINELQTRNTGSSNGEKSIQDTVNDPSEKWF